MTAYRLRQHRSDPTPYRGRYLAVGTRHGKQQQFAPAFRTVLGATLVTPPDLDTDQFGTFTGETRRCVSPVEAARNKVCLAIAVTGLRIGLASEASYGPLPGGWSGHEEILLFCDTTLGIEVVEGYRTTAVPAMSQRVADIGDLRGPLLAGLPDQALVVRPSQPAVPQAATITKGITGIGTVRSAVAAAAADSQDGLALVEPDLRAHHNPSRRKVLTYLAGRMARRLGTTCPECGAPGYGRVATEPGLPCRLCTTPTTLTLHEIHACTLCSHRTRQRIREPAEPANCPFCNP